MALKFGQKLRNIIGTVAPLLGTSLGGPLGGLAGKLLKEKLGAETDDQALAILETPEGLAKAKEAENELKARAMELEIDLEEINQKDRDSARNREIQVRDWTPRILGYSIVGAAISIGGAVVFGYAVNSESTVSGAVIGYLFGEAKQVMSYYFGSSSGSATKTSLLMDKK